MNIYSSLAIAGVGEADLFVDRVRSAKDLAVEAALKAMDDAGIRSHDIDGVITASPAADPHFVFSSLVGEALNINARLSTALQNAGASPMLGVMYAARAIASGEAHTVLVCESDSRGAKFKGDKIQAMRAARPWSDDFEDPFGLTVPAKYALLAQAWMHRYGAKRISLGYKDGLDAAHLPQTQLITYQSGDVFAIVTDGLTDQVGGAQPSGKPVSFGYRRLERILLENADKEADTIAQQIKQGFENWQASHQRRDDVTAIVFKL